MRKLSLKDAIDFVKIMKKANLKSELKSLYDAGKNGVTQETLGYECIVTIIFSVAEEGVDKELYSLLGRISERTAEEIADMSIDALHKNVLVEIAKENNLSDFFKSAAKFMK